MTHAARLTDRQNGTLKFTSLDLKHENGEAVTIEIPANRIAYFHATGEASHAEEKPKHTTLYLTEPEEREGEGAKLIAVNVAQAPHTVEAQIQTCSNCFHIKVNSIEKSYGDETSLPVTVIGARVQSVKTCAGHKAYSDEEAIHYDVAFEAPADSLLGQLPSDAVGHAIDNKLMVDVKSKDRIFTCTGIGPDVHERVASIGGSAGIAGR